MGYTKEQRIINSLTGKTKGGSSSPLSSNQVSPDFELPNMSAVKGWDDKLKVRAFTDGSILFSENYKITQDNSNIFWDNTNKRLGIGTSSPSSPIHVVGDFKIQKTGDSSTFLFYDLDPVSHSTLRGYGNAVSFETRTAGDDIIFKTALTNEIARFDTENKRFGIGTASPTSILHVVGLPVYANNAAAVAGGLTAGAFYRTGADPDPVCVVH